MNRATDAFDEQFAALAGFESLHWQRRLFERFVDGDVPTAVDLPTGLGKTSAMAIWLIARAYGAKLPRRLAYVVDRRAVVDQATEEAEKLRKALEGEAKHFDLLDERTRTQAKRVAAELKKRLGIGEKRKLSISTLRGAHVDNREWLDDPAAPAIIVGTVDMIGSRLLFEGYGVSRKMRPYHAGLIGADTLVVLDEAHLVPPFEALLQSIVGRTPEFGPRLDSDREIVPPFRLLSLSATGRARTPATDGGVQEAAFRLEVEDFSDQIVQKRLAAKKAVSFVKIDDEKDELVEALAQNAWKLSGKGGNPARCLVYCDRREIAERTKRAIEALAAGNRKSGTPKFQVDTELFVGARRVKERENAKDWLHDHGFLAGSDSPAKPTFLIATSAGEVGVDLDADHMVCDLVPWERMVQRLGRVNRRGEGDATIVVVHGDEPKPKKPDAPTDQEKRQAVGYRSLAILGELPNLGGGRDASPGALRELKLRAVTDKALGEMIEKATTPEPLRPALTRPTVDAWSMTSLENHTGRPEVAPWLRGWVEDDQQTTVIWRACLPVRQGMADRPLTSIEKKDIEEFFEAAPPHESEKLETEAYRVAEWLQSRASLLLGREEPASEEQNVGADSDSETLATDGTETGEAEARSAAPQAMGLRPNDLVAFVLGSDDGYAAHYLLGDLALERKDEAKKNFYGGLVGKTFVLDVRFGGLEDGLLKDKGNNHLPTADASDDWSRKAGFRVRPAEEKGRKTGVSRPNSWFVAILTAIPRSGSLSSITGRVPKAKMRGRFPNRRSSPITNAGPNRKRGELPRRWAFPTLGPLRWRSRRSCMTKARKRRAGNALSGRREKRTMAAPTRSSPRRTDRSTRRSSMGTGTSSGHCPTWKRMLDSRRCRRTGAISSDTLSRRITGRRGLSFEPRVARTRRAPCSKSAPAMSRCASPGSKSDGGRGVWRGGRLFCAPPTSKPRATTTRPWRQSFRTWRQSDGGSGYPRRPAQPRPGLRLPRFS